MTKDEAKEQLTKSIEQAKANGLNDEEIVNLAKQLCPRMSHTTTIRVRSPRRDDDMKK